MLIGEQLRCYHCGQACTDEPVTENGKPFCCYGCKVIYEIINANQLCQYYELENHPGRKGQNIDTTYDVLDGKTVRKKLLDFDSADFARVRFYIPSIHCVSCIWLLENLAKADPGISRTEVNFTSKSVSIDFNPEKIRLSQLASLIARLGYAPELNHAIGETRKQEPDRSPVMRLALAGFCFGNIMLLSFPEYLGLEKSDLELRQLFTFISLSLALPVLVYSAKGYLESAWRSVSQKQINIDVPIALGLLALFSRSTWEILTGYGPGYLDSFTGLVFFLLIGRWFQNKTYAVMAFDRDFKSYLPLAVQKEINNKWMSTAIHELMAGDVIRLRNQEIVPADSTLLDAQAYFDYSFVSGEARAVLVKKDHLVYAGGRLLGQSVTMTIAKQPSQSQLTSLWNHEAFKKPEESGYRKIIDRSARQFTWIVLWIALFTVVYWMIHDESQMWLVLTSVLMVACPCALALAAPFTYGSMVRAFGRNGFYLKNGDIIERLATIDAVVFDKTGTITSGQDPKIDFQCELSKEELAAVKTLTACSTHPLSTLIANSLPDLPEKRIDHFLETPGKGIEGTIAGHVYTIGSPNFAGYVTPGKDGSSCVVVAVDDEPRGFFSIAARVRPDMDKMLKALGQKCTALLSGDGEMDRLRMEELFNPGTALLFNQSPHDKLEFIKGLQRQGKKVLMVGDGLNDAGALRQSDVGLAVTDDTGVFTPACDGIMQGNQVSHLATFLDLAKTSTVILKSAFALSFLYNAIALSFAVTGHLTPLVAAVLMPISSVSVVTFSTLAVHYSTRKLTQQIN